MTHPFEHPAATLQKRVAVIPIEGILRKPVGGQRNEDGFALYQALTSAYRVILTTFETNNRRVLEWLDKEGIVGYDDILYGDLCILMTEPYWVNMIRIMRQRGYNLSLVVVNGPGDARDVLGTGVPALMYSHPAYGLPEWLPESRRGAEAWSSLVDKIESDREARMNDKRMEEHVE